MDKHSKKILVVGPAWVGDLVMAQSFLKALIATQADVQIDLLVADPLRLLATRMPEVRQIISHRIRHGELGLGARWRLARRMQHEQYASAYVLPRSFKSALVPWFARVPQRIGHRGEMRFGVLTHRHTLAPGKSNPNVCNYLQLLGLNVDIARVKREYAPALRVDEKNQAQLCERFRLDPGLPRIAIMPGAEFGRSKQWPEKRFAELVSRLQSKGYQVVILGAPKEKELGNRIARNTSSINLSGQTSLVDVIDLLALCRAAVSNDSGLMHIAAAVGCPVVGLYGSTSPDYTPPLSSNSRTVFLDLECSPCWQRTCRYHHYRCLEDISVSRIEASMDRIL